MPVFTPISQQRFVDHVMVLAARITADDWVPSYLIGIGRGGLVPATFLSHACGLPMLSVDYSSKVEEFADGALARLAARTRGGDKLLFVDDINDTGGTISRLRSILAEQGAVAGSIRFATLIDNSRSAERVEYHADIIDRAVTKDWFVFPWEAVAPQATLTEDAAAVPERTA